MSVGSILVGIVLLAALGVAMIQPWWRPARRQVAQLTTDPHTEYEALVAAIRDLDFDYQAGVVTEADYQPLRNDLAAQAVTVLQELDRGAPDAADLEAQIEVAVGALRATRRPAAGVNPDGAGAKLELSCPNCHGPVEIEDRFCATCGQMLVEEVVAV